MSLLAPAWLLLGALAVVILLLHMRRRRQLDVPSVMLWRLVESSATPHRRLRWPPPSLLLLLQILIILFVALALAQPLIGADRADARHTVYVIDTSASMRATDEAPSRFDAARLWLAGQIRATSFDTNDRVSVVTAGAVPRVEAARQTAAAGLLPLVDALTATDGPANWDGAAALAAPLLRDGEETVVVLVTDGADEAIAGLDEAFPNAEVERAIFAGDDRANVGLTATIALVEPEEPEATPAAEIVAPVEPPEGAAAPPPLPAEGTPAPAPAEPAAPASVAANPAWHVTGTVRFSGPEPAEVTIQVLFQPEGTDGFVNWTEIVVPRPETPAPGEGAVAPARPPVVEAAIDEEIALPGPGALVLRLPDDAGPADNEVRFILRDAPVTARVLYIGEPTLPLLAALQAVGNVEVFPTMELPGNEEEYDLVVVDGVTVPRIPDTNVLWVGTGRPSPAQEPPVLADAYVSGWIGDHPLSTGVDWTALALQTGYRVPRLAGAAVLAEAGGAPLVQARTTPRGREVRLAFDIGTSGWPDEPGFPVFVNGLVDWLGLDLGATAVPPCVVGTPCPVEARLLDARILNPEGVEAWSATIEDGDYVLPGVERSFVPDRAGFYRLQSELGSRLLAVNGSVAGEAALAPVEGQDVSLPDVGASARVWWWLLLAALVLLLIEGWIAGRGPEQFLRRRGLASSNPLALRKRLQLGFRIASVVFLVMAIAGVPWVGREPAEDVVVVMGDDLGTGAPNPDRDRLLREVQAAQNGGRGGLIAAGGDNRIAGDIGGALPAEALGGTTPGTNIEEALLLAAAMTTGDRPARVVLATDGNETEGEIAQAIAALQARGVTVDIQPVNELPPGEVLVEAVNAPAKVYAGDTFGLFAVIYSQAQTTGTITVKRAGETVLETEAQLFPGRNRVDIPAVPAGDAGNLLIEVAVTAPGDTHAENNTNGVIVAVQPTPAIAIVTPQPPLGEYFAGALGIQGLTAEILLPEDAPDTIDGWLEYQAVVLMNVPALDLDTTQQEQLEEFVETHGRGLLILGGENAFGPGGYYGTPFERLSPLSSLVPHEMPQVAIVYVIDRSGSMGAAVPGAPDGTNRLDVAKSSTISAIDLLNPNALIGLVLFDSSAYILTPLGPRDVESVATALAPVATGGGTNIYPGFELALGMLNQNDAATRHIVIMTDGITTAADFPALVRVAQQNSITVSTIAIGVGETPLLAGIAAETGGQYHATQDFRAMPAIMAQETLMLARQPLQERVAQVVWQDREADFLAGLPDPLPSIYSYVLTTAKPLADVHIAVVDEEGDLVPLLATWRYGNGHVLALATHGAGAGTAEWIQMPQYPLMWSQIVRSFLPDIDGPGLNVALTRSGDVVRVTADYLDTAGVPMTGHTVTATIGTDAAYTIPLEEAGAGRYEGTFTVGQPGTYHVAVGADELTAEADMYVAYPARFDFGRADFDKLQALAAATGGQLLLGDEPVFGDEMRWVAVPGWRIWALIALLLFLADLTIRHAPSLFGLRRRAAPVGPALAVPA